MNMMTQLGRAGGSALAPISPTGMIFGTALGFDAEIESIAELERRVNAVRTG